VQKAVDEAMEGGDGSNCGAYMTPLREASDAVRRGDRPAAEAAIARARAIDEADRKRAEEAGVAYREPGFAETLRIVEVGGRIEPKLKDWIAYQNRGVERANAGDHKAAVADLTQAIRLIGATPNPALYYLRGKSLLAIQDFAEAKRMFEIGLEQDPKNTTLAQLLKQAEQAISNASADAGSGGPAASARVRPVDAALAARLQAEADAAVKAGNLGGALDLYTQSIEVSPPNTALYFLRGRVFLSLDRRDEAAADFKAGLALDPGNATLKSLLEQARRKR
jgi:tetratricopeptide (TPR) repeat protein